MRSVIGLVPARGGSKRLPGKNLKPLGGRPLLEWTARAALAAKTLDRVILSTDSEEIAAAGRACGLEVPFLRPAELAGDTVPDRPVLLHLLDWLRDRDETEPEFLLLLRPTTPFKSAARIDQAVTALRGSDADSLRTVCRTEGVHHPAWMYTEERGLLRPLLEHMNPTTHPRSQDLPGVWRLNGVVDVLRPGVIRAGGLYGEAILPLELPEEEALDIDTARDFALAEALVAAERNRRA